MLNLLCQVKLWKTQIKGKDFLNKPNHTGCITKNQQRGLHQIKKLFHSKETTNIVKRHFIEWEKFFASYPSDKYLEYIENSKTQTLPKIKNCIQKWASEMDRNFSDEEVQIPNI